MHSAGFCFIKYCFLTLSLLSRRAGSTYVHLFSAAVDFDFDRLHIRFPDRIGSSMGMAHIIAEVSSLLTNSTFSHDRTSLTIRFVSDVETTT